MIAPIPPLPGMPSLPSFGGAQAAQNPGGADAFSNVIGNAVNALQTAQSNASAAEAQAAAGQGNLADTMIAASQASLDTQVASDLLTKAVTSYNTIMSMSF